MNCTRPTSSRVVATSRVVLEKFHEISLRIKRKNGTGIIRVVSASSNKWVPF